MELKGACIVGQSGGPSSVINSSIYGAIKTALESESITRVLGAEHGIKGVLSDRLFDLDKEDPEELAYLLNTPSSELGSCRYMLKEPEEDDTDYKRILEIFKKYDVRYFFYNGGNDSMDTCNKISRYMESVNYECRVIGIPKTIDNDLVGTDHCPGFGSAARYIATTCMEVYKDAVVYDTGMVVVIEIMGRNAGWLTGAAALAKASGCGPDLIYLPEKTFDIEQCLAETQRIYKEKNNVIIAISEGIHDKDGVFISEYGSKGSAYTDAFGHTQLGGAGAILANIIKEKMNVKIRAIEFNLMQRCGAHLAAQTDIEEAFLAGGTAVLSALAGETGKMVAFRRMKGGADYYCDPILVPLADVANLEKKVPLEWILDDGQGVTEDFIEYALPLIQGEAPRAMENSLPRFARLKKILAE